MNRTLFRRMLILPGALALILIVVPRTSSTVFAGKSAGKTPAPGYAVDTSMEPASKGISPFGAFTDTTWFGGTTWDAVDMRWEALRDSIWTFETGVGSSINTDPAVKSAGFHRTMEGWSGHDLTDGSASLRFLRRTGLCAINGSFSLHAGATQAEADSLCWAAGQGYGNYLAVRATKLFTYPGSGSVTLQYAYSVETETGFDYAYVLIDTTGDGSADPVPLATYTGTQSGTASLVLNPGTTLRSTPGSFKLAFQFVSDGSYSDEDGLNPTACGHSTIDDISLSGAVADLSTFETGNDGWIVESPLSIPHGALFSVGDWSNLKAVADLSGPGLSCACDFQDSVLVFFDPSIGAGGGHPLDQVNIVMSPWIELNAPDVMPHDDDVIVEYEGYFDLPLENDVFVVYVVQWSPLVCAAGGGPVSEIRRYGFFDYSLPGGNLPSCGCRPDPVRRTLVDILPTDATVVRVGIGVVNFCRTIPFGPCSGITNSSPWIDNVRIAVVASGTSGVPPSGAPSARAVFDSPRPNPVALSTGVTLRFSLPARGAARIEIYDVAGRLVRTVLDDVVDSGWTELTWDARDEGGQAVASGLYFVRFAAGGEKETKKVVVRR